MFKEMMKVDGGFVITAAGIIYTIAGYHDAEAGVYNPEGRYVQ